MFRDSKVMFVAALSVALWFPLAQVQWFAGHEQISYVLRTLEWAGELRRGHLYPRWCPDFYGGYGSPLFLFYGPVPYATAAVLTATFLDPFTALKIVALIGSLLSGVGLYALVFGETRQRDAALLAAVAFLAAPYRIANLFERGDIGEFLCVGMLPVAIALYRAAALEPRPRRARWLAVGASVFHALVIMTHPILGLWGTLVIGVIVAASALALGRRGMWRRGLVLVGALACAPALAAIYVVPAIAYRSLTHTAAMIVGFYEAQTQWILVRTLFEKNVMGTRMPGTFYRIGPIVVVAFAAMAVGLLRNPRAARRGLGWTALTVALLYLTLPAARWFWAPGRIPLAEFIQFPWRLLGPAVLTACVALGVGAAAAYEHLSEVVRGGISVAIGSALLLGLALPHITTREKSTKGMPTDPETIRQKIYSATDADEYLPGTVAAPPKTPRRALVQAAAGAEVTDAFSDGSAHDLALRADRGGATLVLGLHAFPGWRARTQSGPGKARLDADGQGLLRLTLPAAGSYRVRVYFGTTAAEWVGGALSALAALALALLLAHGTPVWAWLAHRFERWLGRGRARAPREAAA